jgi:OHCU decarboxylase
MSQSIIRLNEMSTLDAESEFLKCCGSKRWAQTMAKARPFESDQAIFDEADALFGLLSDDDWLEAFRAHPKIGEKKAATHQSETAKQWSSQEQSRTESAAAETKKALAEGNRDYERRFGFIFIVCATGKSADEMLTMLEQRMANDPAAELRVAAEEQRKITHLRLQKLLESPAA